MTTDDGTQQQRGTEQLPRDELLGAQSKERELLRHGLSLLIYFRDGVRVVPLFEGQSAVIGRYAPADVELRDGSLSRRHALIRVEDGVVWVEDLGSTNGTWVEDQRIDRARLEDGDEVSFGSVVAVVRALGSDDHAGNIGSFDLDSHDRFMAELAREVLRAQTFGRRLALLMIRGDGHVGGWSHGIRACVRAFDRCALYSADTVEVLLQEASADQAHAIASTIARATPDARCGIAVFPADSSSPDQLTSVALRALRGTDATTPIRLADTPTTAGDDDDGDVVVLSDALREVFDTADRIARAALPVLIQGETGTGKEVVARRIHDRSGRDPFLCINCGSIPTQLMESTLFGHERGAFTGADRQHKGVFESATGGTVMLDEIGELSAAVQAALLRVLENKRISRVGSSKEMDVDVRILAATHRDLEAMCLNQEFRHDLLYRLNAMTIRVPPLRDRPEEILPLALSFIKQANQTNGCTIGSIDDDSVYVLEHHSWPGNVRELRNAIERAVVIARGTHISVEDLPRRMREIAAGEPEPREPLDLKGELQDLEAKLIRDTLQRCGQDRREAARLLNLPLRTLAHKMSVHGIRIRGKAKLPNR